MDDTKIVPILCTAVVSSTDYSKQVIK